MNAFDELYLSLAIKCAHQAIGLSSPNPRVGCVLVNDGGVLGQGFTQAAGQAHAEVMAIREAQSAGHDLAGCTVYVTLEPCSHFGRTPPCVDALLAIQPKRIVVALVDANPLVAGKGIANLRVAGVQVDVIPSESQWAQAAFDLNIGFISRMSQSKVFTRLKWASSADGKTALPDGRSQWITGAVARADGHLFRARADVLVTGIGTVLHDNPQLNVRGTAVAHPPIKCVVDSFTRTPVSARLFEDGAPVWLANLALDANDAAYLEQKAREQILCAAHPHLKILSLPKAGRRVDLKALWQYFYDQHINEVHVEAGAQLNAAVLKLDLVDEVLMYIAPRVVGDGKNAVAFAKDECLDDLMKESAWKWSDCQLLDSDARLRLRRKR
ncbi:bifunctional diaminohydroxyphosphoribosylaminopyrimidine deaminase/5-amino-6-(5-phosphoribosylamino)uracil reductase RibD [Hydromonas duriensis]|uniref:Riboflavin biosynthesis protein RibD n=1 Tax=Hydromonas duriensis TaxID=1527608 RepID=A0A4R6YBY6_9BURK|nr:bifunctional diaminohydroxyphosphoribosylaminopyrimidine deaminase/5-amino-6-(5-phosphoribosylamino)uracil reductase RibD [Hydromonas duriensis]TDR33129.1 diaminohydroxyphosphoribosylaminopyrimidine deaminase [Hydromonas duriensis]